MVRATNKRTSRPSYQRAHSKVATRAQRPGSSAVRAAAAARTGPVPTSKTEQKTRYKGAQSPARRGRSQEQPPLTIAPVLAGARSFRAVDEIVTVRREAG